MIFIFLVAGFSLLGAIPFFVSHSTFGLSYVCGIWAIYFAIMGSRE